MGDPSASYIRTVQHLIEKCLLFRMSQEECAEALSRHANIGPVITNTVWKELEKENREFFEAYAKERQEMVPGTSDTEIMERVRKLLSDTIAKNTHDDDDDD